MKLGVSLKIDVSKIDRSKLFKGQKGTYLDAQVFIDIEQDQYGNNGMITQAVTKQEKESGQRGAILGNAKIFWNDQATQGQQQSQQQWQQQQQQTNNMVNQQNQQYNDLPDDFDDIPFAPIALQHSKLIYCI